MAGSERKRLPRLARLARGIATHPIEVIVRSQLHLTFFYSTAHTAFMKGPCIYCCHPRLLPIAPSR